MGRYFPTKNNLNQDFPKSEKYGRHIQDYVSRWMSLKNLPFKNITEMKIYFKIKHPISIQEAVNSFLDSKLEEINNMEYISITKRVIHDLDIHNLNSDHITNWFRSRFSKGKLKFENITKLKEAAGLFKSTNLYRFLETKKPQIENLNFIPTTENVVQERPDFRKIENLSALIHVWLRQNNLPSISELKEAVNQESYVKKLSKILDPQKVDIKTYKFKPTVENIGKMTDEFNNFRDLPTYISRYLKQNGIADNLTEYLHDFGIMSDSRKLKDFLDRKEPNIKNGKYFPTIMNLRKDQDQFGLKINSMTSLTSVRAEWFDKNVGMSMTELIEKFQPTYDQLGYSVQKHGYPAQFKSQKLRVSNAIFQTVLLENQNKLIKFKPTPTYNKIESLLKYLKKLDQWKFVDILTGEIFTLQDLYNGFIILHHINFIKADLSLDNLVFIFRDNHAFINTAKNNHEALSDFFLTILKKNINSIKENNVPDSWRLSWRKIALNDGIRLPPQRYIPIQGRPTIINYPYKNKRLDSF